jgi:hypothetical protein
LGTTVASRRLLTHHLDPAAAANVVAVAALIATVYVIVSGVSIALALELIAFSWGGGTSAGHR